MIRGIMPRHAVSMYARGMTVREIDGHLEELYGIDVSPNLISTITDAVLETVTKWQGRPLNTCYPLVFFDAIRVKIGDAEHRSHAGGMAWTRRLCAQQGDVHRAGRPA
jgi:transposase-like protein